MMHQMLLGYGGSAPVDYYTGSEWSPGGINNPEEAFTSSTTGSGSNGGSFGPFTYTFVAGPPTGVMVLELILEDLWVLLVVWLVVLLMLFW